VVTEPLDAQMRRAAGRRASVLTEAETYGRWLRWLPDNRAMFAGAASVPVRERLADRTLVQRTGQLMYELSVRYPVISGLPARWSTRLPVVHTLDGIPWIGPHRNYPFHFFAMALGWNGDAYAWIAAKAALRYFNGEPAKEDLVFRQ
jgi:glycine/D-amino acid oxidase-like deaminating enzyme